MLYNLLLNKILIIIFKLIINNLANKKFYTLIVYINTIKYIIFFYIIFKTNLIENFIINDFNKNVRFVKSTLIFFNVKFTFN